MAGDRGQRSGGRVTARPNAEGGDKVLRVGFVMEPGSDPPDVVAYGSGGMMTGRVTSWRSPLAWAVADP